MSEINSQHALQELIANLRDHDPIKARIVLDHLPLLGEKDQRRILYELNKGEDAMVIPLLVFLAVRYPEIQAAFPTLSETIFAKALNNPGLLLAQLAVPAPEQWYYVMLAGKLRIEGAGTILSELLTQTEEVKVLQSCLTALGLFAEPEAVNAISDLLYSGQEELLFAAVQALGQIATPTAIHRLAESLGRNDGLDLLILDTFAAIQDEVAIRKLNETMQSRSVHLRNYSKGQLIALGAKAVPVLVENLSCNDPDLQIHSLNALQEIGDSAARMAVRKLINTQPANANVRFAAFEAIAGLPGKRGDYVLASGLNDPDSNVRIAAARAIDANFDEVLAAGIRNMTKNADREAEAAVRAILDSQAATIFLDLVRHQVASATIATYLARQAHPEIRNYFLQVLSDAGEVAFAEQIMALGETAAVKREQVCAVDDSRMVLSIYRSVLNELGFEPVLFSLPEEALLWLAVNQPKFVCTDLNMPKINGIELTKRTRALYSKESLPVILVTTQDDKKDTAAAYAAGISEMITKPFDTAKIKAVLTTLGLL